MSHTPGPWEKVEANTTIPIRSTVTGATVATIRYRENDDDDANVIVAAPDMLEALELAVVQLGEARGKKLNYSLELAIATGNRAIHKARGRA